MPVFISYSHSDEQIVNRLGIELIKRNAYVWIDKWELNIGDSILNRISEAIEKSGALLIILSKASVESEWCNKEFNAGLMRELDEKQVIVMPVLIEDCKIPLFLKEKMYADLRSDFDKGVHDIVCAKSKVTNIYQARLDKEDGTLDWAEDWQFRDELFEVRFTIIQSFKSVPISLLTQIYIFCNERTTDRYKEFEANNLDWIGRELIAQALFELGAQKDYRLHLDDQHTKTLNFTLADIKSDGEYEIYCESRKMGQDNGKIQVINISNYLKQIKDYIQSASRRPTQEENKIIKNIISKSWK